ncbi:MAG: phosphoribosylformylglycinamidine cyclo-ligase [Candidatus Auribacterota bacterium]|nr:phosphoribosylformylglycinamidine cyclo-ligase [Candidatus Auribacterota bacterium]
MDESLKVTYQSAGVNIDEGIKVVGHIKERMKNIVFQNVLSGIGGFGGIIDISATGIKEPVLVSSIDGVGTKTKVAAAHGQYRGVGRDIVAHCVNDIAVQGAKPLFFMDYIGVSRLDALIVDQLIAGILDECTEQGCALLGGETAEMPGVYEYGEFDLVGCIVGIMEKKRIVTGVKIQKSDVIIGLESSGLHTNGFSLARQVLFSDGQLTLGSVPEGFSKPVGDVLLEPHRCYGTIIQALCDSVEVKGMAHITGGGLIENLPRILPDNVDAVIDVSTWETLPIFKLIRKMGPVDAKEMYRVFNMGIGLTVVVDKSQVAGAMDIIKKHNCPAYIIGELAEGNNKVVLNSLE